MQRPRRREHLALLMAPPPTVPTTCREEKEYLVAKENPKARDRISLVDDRWPRSQLQRLLADIRLGVLCARVTRVHR